MVTSSGASPTGFGVVVESSNVAKVPTELITEILLRLPVRSLLRFKCVCRSWFFLISDPQFAESHFHINAAAPTHRLLLLPCLDKDKLESLDLDSPSLADPSAVVTLNLPLLGYSLGSCRGFMLFFSKGIIVLNPCTGFRKQIENSTQLMIGSLYGFGYDSSTGDYLAVRIRLLNAAEIDTFSMKTSSWDHTKCVNVRYMDLGSQHRNGMFLNGSIHWLVISQDTRLRLVIAFDLLEKSLSEIPLPNELAAPVLTDQYRRPELYQVRVLGGCLSLCYTGSRCDKAKIWVMKEYKVQSSWTKAFVVTDCDIPCKHFHPIHLIEGGGVVGTDGRGRLMKFNAEGKLLEHQKYREVYKYVQKYFAMYRESLLSFPGEQPLLRN